MGGGTSELYFHCKVDDSLFLFCFHFLSFQLLLCFKCLEPVLLFTSAPPTTATPTPTAIKQFRTTGHRLVQRLLTHHTRPIYRSLLSTQPTKLAQSCLRLLAAMVMQGLDSARQVQQVFNFGYKPLQAFFGKTTPICDPRTVCYSVSYREMIFILKFLQGIEESVRQSFMKFALSFLIIGDNSIISAVLELKGCLF